ncbi:MAG: Xaa-Pro peptidase family protein [Pseudomonadota bacterium]
MAEPIKLDGRHVHFTAEEFGGRLARLRAAMAAEGLDGMLLFAPETQYWLTGYDTFGFCFFQCLVLPLEGAPVLLTRSADRLQALFTSWLEDVRVWKDGAGADPTQDLKAILAETGLLTARLGVEFDTHGLTAANGRRLEATLGAEARLEDASPLVPALRLTKSPAEIAMVRRAAAIGDEAYRAARAEIRPGADEAAILAALQGAVFAAGGDFPANEVIIGSGPAAEGGDGRPTGALLCRYFTGRRALSAEDQITLEWAGVWRRYHAALMRTVPVGAARPEHVSMHAAAEDALLACEAALRPGRTMGEVFAAHEAAFERAGLGHARLNACGYALGARYTPSWMEPQMFHAGAPTVIGPDMVFFLHMILMDARSGAAMCLGRTSLVTESGAEPLSSLPLALDVAP